MLTSQVVTCGVTSFFSKYTSHRLCVRRNCTYTYLSYLGFGSHFCRWEEVLGKKKPSNATLFLVVVIQHDYINIFRFLTLPKLHTIRFGSVICSAFRTIVSRDNIFPYARLLVSLYIVFFFCIWFLQYIKIYFSCRVFQIVAISPIYCILKCNFTD